MFAYCNNNPVNRIDITGFDSLWYQMIVDHDMGFIHRAVVSDIKKNYNVRTEVSLSGFGRADIVNGSAVWEVKHGGTKPMERLGLAFAESCGYVFLNDELDTIGAPGAFNGTIYIGFEGCSYRVEYCTPFWGAVLYFVVEDPNYNGEYAVVYVPHTKKSEETNLKMAGMVGAAGAGAAYAYSGSFGGGGPSLSFPRQANYFI